MVVDIPLGGKCRAAVGLEITGEVEHTYTVWVGYGTINPDGSFSVASCEETLWMSSNTVTGAQMSTIVNVDSPTLNCTVDSLDALVVVCENLDANGFPEGIYASLDTKGAIRVYLPYGAKIVSVGFTAI